MNLIIAIVSCLCLSLAPTGDALAYQPVVEAVIGHSQSASCLVTLAGDLWAGTLGGGLINLDNLEAEVLDAKVGLPGNRVNDCIVVDETLWVATDSGLARLKSGQRTFQRLADGRFLRLAQTGDQLLAARDDGALLAAVPGDEPVTVAHRLDRTVIALAGASDGRYAAGSMDGTVQVGRPGQGGQTLNTGLPITALAFSGAELRVLVPGQLFRLEPGGLTPVPGSEDVVGLISAGDPLHAAGLAAVEVAAVRRIGPTWYAATDAGVYLSATAHDQPVSWHKLPSRGCPCGPRIAALASYNGDLWVGGFDTGLCRFDGQLWHHFTAPAELPSNMVNHMTVGRHRLYVATLKGLVVVDDQGVITRHTRSQCVDNTAANCPWYESVTGVASDAESRNVWVADTGSVHRWSSRKWKHLYRRRGIQSERITRIAAYQGRVAVGTSDQGVLLADATLQFTAHNDQQGLADNWVMDLEFDHSGALWVATCTRGISRYFEGQWQTWDTRHGLGDDYTLSVADIGGRIWVGHFRGVSILTEQGVVHLRPEDGLAGSEVHDIIEHNGHVYLATDGGITMVSI